MHTGLSSGLLDVFRGVGAFGHAVDDVVGDGDGKKLGFLGQEADALCQLLWCGEGMMVQGEEGAGGREGMREE